MTHHRIVCLLVLSLLLCFALDSLAFETRTSLRYSPETSFHRIEAFEPKTRCFDAEVPEAGLWWVVLRTRQPSTAPSLTMISGRGLDPRTVERVEVRLVEVAAPDVYSVCLGSDPFFDARVLVTRAGDPLEIEVEPDPTPHPDEIDWLEGCGIG